MMKAKQNQTIENFSFPKTNFIIPELEEPTFQEPRSLFKEYEIDPMIGMELLNSYKPLSVSLFQKQWGNDYQTKQNLTLTRLEELQLKESLQNFKEDCNLVSWFLNRNAPLEAACLLVSSKRNDRTLNSEKTAFKECYLLKYPEKTMTDFYKYQIVRNNQHKKIAKQLLLAPTLRQELEFWNHYSNQKSFKTSFQHFLNEKRHNAYWDQEVQTAIRTCDTQYLRKYLFLPANQETDAIIFFQYQVLKGFEHADICRRLLLSSSIGERDALWNNYEKIDCLKNELYHFCHKEELKSQAALIVNHFEEGIYNHYPFLSNYSEEEITNFLKYQVKKQQHHKEFAQQLLQAPTLEERAILWNHYPEQEAFLKRITNYMEHKKRGNCSNRKQETFLTIYPEEVVNSFLHYQISHKLIHRKISKQLLNATNIEEKVEIYRNYDQKNSFFVLFFQYQQKHWGGKQAVSHAFPFLSNHPDEVIEKALTYQAHHSRVYASFATKLLEAPNYEIRLKLYQECPNRNSYVEVVRYIINNKINNSSQLENNDCMGEVHRNETSSSVSSEQERKERITKIRSLLPPSMDHLLTHVTYPAEETKFQMGFQNLIYPTFQQLFQDDFATYEQLWMQFVSSGNPYACELCSKYLLLWNHDFQEVLEGNQFYYVACLYSGFLRTLLKKQEDQKKNQHQKVINR